MYVPDMKHTTKDIIYTAGLFDGEGSISISKNVIKKSKKPAYNVRVRISNTYLPVLEWVRDKFGGSIYDGCQSKAKCYCYSLSSRQAVKFLKLIRPHLKIKGPQAELAMLLQEHLSSGPRCHSRPLTDNDIAYREDIRCQIMELNKLS